MILENPYRWCGTGGFLEQGQFHFIGLADRSSFVSCCFPFIFCHFMGWYYHGICDLSKVYLPELLERVSARKRGRRLGTYRFASILQSSHLQWRILTKKFVAYLDAMLLFVFKTCSFNFLNSQYLDIFGFIRFNFMCFSDTGFLEIYSVFHKKGVVFFYTDNL